MGFLGTLLGGAAGLVITGGNPMGAMAGASLGGGFDAAQSAQDAASTQADAATQAAGTQAQSQREALDLQREMYDRQTALQEPYRQAGLTSQNRLMELMGLGGNTSAAGYGSYSRDFGMQDFQQDPGYAFRLSEGMKAMDRQAAARGGLISGGALKAAQRYGQDMGSQEYQNAFNRYQTNRQNQLGTLGGLITTGQSAASNQGSAAGNFGQTGGASMTGYGNALAGGINDAGQSRAAGQLGYGNSIANALNTGASAYSNQQNFNNWLARSNQLSAPQQSYPSQQIDPLAGIYG